jgi:hypothetical protein
MVEDYMDQYIIVGSCSAPQLAGRTFYLSGSRLNSRVYFRLPILSLSLAHDSTHMTDASVVPSFGIVP